MSIKEESGGEFGAQTAPQPPPTLFCTHFTPHLILTLDLRDTKWNPCILRVPKKTKTPDKVKRNNTAATLSKMFLIFVFDGVFD